VTGIALIMVIVIVAHRRGMQIRKINADTAAALALSQSNERIAEIKARVAMAPKALGPERKFIMNASFIRQVFRIMNSIISETEAERVVIFKSKNGSGMPRLGSRLHTSAVYEMHSHNYAHNLVERYENVSLDGDYISMLLDLQTSGMVRLVVDKMNESLLKTIYKTEGIKYSELYYLHTTESGMYYVSIATTSDGFGLIINNPAMRSIIDISVSKLQNLFKKYGE